MEIRFGELYTVTTKPTKVTQEGRDRIRRRLENYVLYEMALPSKRPPLPNDWDWSWVTQKGDFRGRLPKRIAGFYKRKYSIKISSDAITHLGNIAKRYSHEAKTYTFDFTKSFDWMAGDFGDSGSCFWGARDLAREALMRNGVIAVRFYREALGQTGFARAWVKILDVGLVVFNAYGLPCGTISYVLSTLFNISPPRAVGVGITGDPDGLIWMNEDSHVIGLDDDRVDLDFDVPYKLCTSCDEFICEDRFPEGGSRCIECDQL